MGLLERKLNKVVKSQNSNEKDNETVLIPLSKIKPSSKNSFPIVRIVEMAESLRERGLDSNIVVRPMTNGMYEIIAGERRYQGFKYNHEHGYEGFDKVRCVVRAFDDVDAEINLHLSNYDTRGNISEGKKLESVEILTKLYKLKKETDKNFKIEGKLRDYVGKKIGLSGSMVGFYQQISNNLISELKEKVYHDEITIEAALEICKLDSDVQYQIFEELGNQEQVVFKDIESYIVPNVEERPFCEEKEPEEAELVIGDEDNQMSIEDFAEDDRFDYEECDDYEEELEIEDNGEGELLASTDIRILPREAKEQQLIISNELKKLKQIASDACSLELVFMIEDFNSALKTFIEKNVVED